jgi:hypothetical protein
VPQISQLTDLLCRTDTAILTIIKLHSGKEGLKTHKICCMWGDQAHNSVPNRNATYHYEQYRSVPTLALAWQWHDTCGGKTIAFCILLSRATFKQIIEATGSHTVRSESRGALKLQYVDLVVKICSVSWSSTHA